MSEPIRIVSLLPDVLGINGSRGNGEVLATRLRWWGFTVQHTDAGLDSPVAKQADIVVIGHGTSSMAPRALESLRGWSKTLRRLVDSGSQILAVGLGADICGTEITLAGHSSPTEGLGFTPVRATLDAHAHSGEVVGVDWRGRDVAGYLNDRVRRVGHGVTPLVSSLRPVGSSWQGATAEGGDGVKDSGIWCSALSGPLLALNPAIADDIIASVLGARGQELPAATASHQRADLASEHARAAIAGRLGI